MFRDHVGDHAIIQHVKILYMQAELNTPQRIQRSAVLAVNFLYFFFGCVIVLRDALHSAAMSLTASRASTGSNESSHST